MTPEAEKCEMLPRMRTISLQEGQLWRCLPAGAELPRLLDGLQGLALPHDVGGRRGLDAPPDGPHNQIESKPAIEAVG
jgi:hypothetical protein